MLGGVTRHMLPHLPGVPYVHVNRPCVMGILLFSGNSVLKVARTHFLAWGVHRARIPLHFCTCEIQKTNMAVLGYFCLSFNTFVLDPCIFGIDLFSCMFCFPNSDHVIFSREFAFCLFINMYTI